MFVLQKFWVLFSQPVFLDPLHILDFVFILDYWIKWSTPTYNECNVTVPKSSKLLTWTCSICSKPCLLCFIHGTWYVGDTLSKNPWSPPRIVSNTCAVCSFLNQDHSDNIFSFTLPIISVFIIAWHRNVTLNLGEHVRLGGLWKRHSIT